jgi:hypothetical protein
MKVCENCGHIDSPKWRSGRFDYNSEYCNYDDAPDEQTWVVECLKDARNFEPLVDGLVTYYRRGKLGMYLYRVPTCDFQVERERKRHDFDKNQCVLFSEGFSAEKSSEEREED